VIGRDFDEDDPNAVGVLDPHFGQSPGLGYWLLQISGHPITRISPNRRARSLRQSLP
jgi:hypothetical protein